MTDSMWAPHADGARRTEHVWRITTFANSCATVDCGEAVWRPGRRGKADCGKGKEGMGLMGMGLESMDLEEDFGFCVLRLVLERMGCCPSQGTICCFTVLQYS
jgi:hypothetical protein